MKKEKIGQSSSRQVRFIDTASLHPSQSQPRVEFNKSRLMELASSIVTHGILQPILVRRTAQNRYEIIAGERRFRAAKMAGLKRIPCLDVALEKEQSYFVSLVENIQREDLNPIEEAMAYEKLKLELKLSQDEIAHWVGKDRASVANILRLLKLPRKLQEMVTSSQLSMGHARALLAVSDQETMSTIARKIIHDGLSVRKTESIIRALKRGDLDLSTGRKINQQFDSLSALEKEIQRKIEEAVGAKAVFRKSNEEISLTLSFSSVARLNYLLDKLDIEI